MTTDTMRQKFEEWAKSQGLNQINTSLAYFAASKAYEQGQRDLIEAMGEPAAWISESGGPGVIDSVPLYRIPEDAKK